MQEVEEQLPQLRRRLPRGGDGKKRWEGPQGGERRRGRVASPSRCGEARAAATPAGRASRWVACQSAARAARARAPPAWGAWRRMTPSPPPPLPEHMYREPRTPRGQARRGARRGVCRSTTRAWWTWRRSTGPTAQSRRASPRPLRRPMRLCWSTTRWRLPAHRRCRRGRRRPTGCSLSCPCQIVRKSPSAGSRPPTARGEARSRR